MNIIFATDLDRTIIFSSKFVTERSKVNCVEKTDREISFMTHEARSKLEELKQMKDLVVIPITTRSLEQYKRVEIAQDCEYAVTTNGGIILYKGKEFEPWTTKVNKILEDYSEEYTKVKNQLESMREHFTTEIKKVDDIFYYVKVKPESKEKLFNELKYIDTEIWNYTIQGIKLYVIPKGITKENALNFIKCYIKDPYVIASGDGKLDKGFLDIGDIAIIPENSEVLNYIVKDFTVVEGGLEGTIELLKIVEGCVNEKRSNKN